MFIGLSRDLFSSFIELFTPHLPTLRLLPNAPQISPHLPHVFNSSLPKHRLLYTRLLTSVSSPHVSCPVSYLPTMPLHTASHPLPTPPKPASSHPISLYLVSPDSCLITPLHLTPSLPDHHHHYPPLIACPVPSSRLLLRLPPSPCMSCLCYCGKVYSDPAQEWIRSRLLNDALSYSMLSPPPSPFSRLACPVFVIAVRCRRIECMIQCKSRIESRLLIDACVQVPYRRDDQAVHV